MAIDSILGGSRVGRAMDATFGIGAWPIAVVRTGYRVAAARPAPAHCALVRCPQRRG
jgi:hypothetical protein